MKGALARIIGVVLIVTGLIGIVFTSYLLFSTWTLKDDTITGLEADIDLIDSTLATTAEGLVITRESLVASVNSVAALKITLEQTADAIDATSPMVDMLVVLLEEDLPTTINAAQLSLAAAEESAEIIDSMLEALTAIPFVSDDIYNPEVPLHIALRQVSDSLDPLNTSFTSMEESLSASSENLDTIQAEINLMAVDLNEISTSIESAEAVIVEYQTLVSNLQSRLESIQENLAGRLNAAFLLFTFILVWFIVSQVGMLVQGVDLLTR